MKIYWIPEKYADIYYLKEPQNKTGYVKVSIVNELDEALSGPPDDWNEAMKSPPKTRPNADWIIPIDLKPQAKKKPDWSLKDTAIHQTEDHTLAYCIKYLKEGAAKNNKPLTGKFKDTVDKIEEYLRG